MTVKLHLLLMLCAVLTACTTTAPSQPQQTLAQLQTGNIGVFTSGQAGFDTHTFYYDTGREVVVFDAQFTEDLARQCIDAIAAKTTSPIRYVVITHPNPDKFNGVGPFRQLGATIVSSKATADAIPGVHAYKKYFFINIAGMFTEDTYPPEASVDKTFTGSTTLQLDGGSVELRELSNSGVSSTQTVAWIPTQRALFVGDLVHHKAHAWLEGGIVDGKPQPNLTTWNAALEELLAYTNATVYGGRGEAAPVVEAVKAQQKYLTTVKTLIRDYLGNLDNAQVQLQGNAAADHHKAIAVLTAKAFPNYTLPYMVEYGVYGLVNTLAAP